MKRWILSIAALLLFLCLILTGFGSWLLRSTDGAGWLIETVSNTDKLQITAGHVDGRLADKLDVDELVVAWPGGQLTVQKLHLDWDPASLLSGVLHVRALNIDSLIIHSIDDAGQVTSTANSVAEETFAATDLAFLPSWLVVEIDHLKIIDFHIAGEEGAVVIADELTGSYLWSRRQINASTFTYLSPYVHLRGAFDWALRRPHLNMTAAVHLPDTVVSPELFKDLAVPVSFPGQLAWDGDWNNFSGPVHFGTVADDASTVWLRADAQGSWQGINFADLKGHYLNGGLAGTLDLSWLGSYRMSGQLTGTGLHPEVLVEDLDGTASLDVAGELLVTYDDEPLQAHFSGTIHEARLRGHTIAGQLAAAWQDDALAELDLDLSSEDARIIAKGKPSERLDLDVDAKNLNAFHVDIAGQLKTSGWLRWADGYLTGALEGSANNIQWQDYSLANLNFKSRHASKQAPLALELDAQHLQHADLTVDHLKLTTSGLLDNHDIQLVLNGADIELAAQMSGHYQDETWQVELQSLTAQTQTLGSWSLEQPSEFEWNPEFLSIDHLALTSSRDEHLTLNVSEWGSPTRAQADVAWRDLDHRWLTYLQPAWAVEGRSSGELTLEMKGQEPLSLEGRLTADARLNDELSTVAISSLTAELSWLQSGLQLDANAKGESDENFRASARSSQPPVWQWPMEELTFETRWQGVKLNHLSLFAPEITIQGYSDGNALFEILDGKLLQASANVIAEGSAQEQAHLGGFRSLAAELQWDEEQFHCVAQAYGARNGKLSLDITSLVDPDYTWPAEGQIELEIDALTLQTFNRFLPDEVALDGVLQGKASGYWQEDGQIVLNGQAALSVAEMLLHGDEGQVDVLLEDATFDWQWQDEQLTGSLALLLAKEGRLNGRWQLPLPARWPIGFAADGPLQAELQGQMHATGVLAAFAPGLVQELHGQIESDLKLDGTWQSPVFSGSLALVDAGVYLPATGATIEELTLQTSLHNNHLKIEELSMQSGSGSLQGSGGIDFNQWRLERYRLDLVGEHFQIYNFPELQVFVNPELTLTGNLDRTQIKGKVLIPEMSLFGASNTPEALPSHDVVISGEEEINRQALPFDADLHVAVELGDQVWVKTAGVETRLVGEATLSLGEEGQISTRGAINLVEGFYKAYGANLEIKQGLLKYDGGAPANPALRIFAARDVGTVQAGVQISGTADAPVVSLYSRPAMPERDILGYIFMGRPLRADQEGEDALMIGAGALMPRYGETFSDLGISEIDIQGLFAGTGGVRLRKRLAETWELESTLGLESAIDLYYIFKFD